MAYIPTPNYRWDKALAKAMATILARPPKGAKVFRRALAHSLAFGQKISQEGGPLISTVGATTTYPIATALLSHHGKEISSLERTLLWLLLELHLKQDGWAVEVAQWLRGLAKGASAGLAMSLGECDGLRALVDKADLLAAEAKPRKEITSHGPFNEAWSGDFRSVLLGLLAAVPRSDELSSGGHPLSGPRAVPTTFSAMDLEEPEDDPVEIWQPVLGNVAETTEEARQAKALARELSGHGIIELLRGVGSVLPDPLGREWWLRAMRGVESALDANELEVAERHLGCLLAIEAGLKPRELGLVVFGGSATEGLLALDLSAGVLRRPEARPMFAFTPRDDEQGVWASVGGDVLFPLSSTLVRLAERLISTRAAAGNLSRVLLDRTVKPSSALTQSLRELWPGRSLPASSFRRRLVAGLAAQLGPDAAQIAFGETFGASAAPTYYAGHSAGALIKCVERLNAPLVSETDAPSRQPTVDYLLGSRVRPIQPPFAESWKKFGVSASRGKGRPSTKSMHQDLVAERDSLAIHFLLCTGQRPNAKLAEFHLADLLPADGMALISDKQTDPARLTRLVATGRFFVGAVEAYVATLERLSKATECAEVRRAARKILRSEMPLLHTITPDGSVEPLNVSDLVARLPEPWASRPNLSRHALNLALTQSGVDPELRYFQMGWVATDAHAVSDMAPYPPQQLGPRLGPIIDGWLQSMGWQGGREPLDPESLHEWHSMRDYARERRDHLEAHRERTVQLKAELEHRREEALPEVASVLAKTLADEGRGWRLELGPDGKSLRLASPGTGDSVTEELVDAWLAPFEGRPPIQGHLAAWILTKALKQAAQSGKCKVKYLPPLSRLGPTAQPSPFMAGLGLAVTHARQLRVAIARRAGELEKAPKDEQERMLASLLVLAIACHTRHRSLDKAIKFATSLQAAKHSERRPWLLRLPYAHGHEAAAGAVSILFYRLLAMPGGPSALKRVVDDEGRALGEFLTKFVPELCGRLPPQEAVMKVFGTLEFAGGAELEGPARLLAAGAVLPATVSVGRAIATDSGLTIGDWSQDLHGRSTDTEDDAPEVAAVEAR